jgi:hypothetical protein
MKKIFLVVAISSFFIALTFVLFGWFGQSSISNAQTTETDEQQKLNRDKSIPKEKVEKAFEEAKEIKESIVAVIENKKPKFKLSASYADHLMYNLPGERGITQNELTFLALNTNLFITVNLGLKKESALVSFKNGLKSITMANVYEISDIGDEASLVKFTTQNKINTQVGLHFIKGRAIVYLCLSNQKRTTKQNEKELMEIVSLVEPLIIARDNFDDGF